MSDLDRVKKLAGLTMESAKGLLQEFKGIGDKMPQPDPSAGAGFRPGKGFMSSEEYAREMLNGMKGVPKPGTDEYEKLVRQMTDVRLGGGFDPEKGFAKGPDDPRSLRFGKAPMRSEAVGDSAECFYDLQDEYCGEQCPSMPHKILIDELVRYLSGDQLQDFCDDFRRHHMDGMEESAVNELKKLAGLSPNDPGAGHQGPGGYVDRDTRALQGDDQTPIDYDAIIKRGKENQIIGKYRPPGSPRDPELDDILRRRAKELKSDPRINDFGTDVRSRIDRIKNKPRDMYKFKWQGNQD